MNFRRLALCLAVTFVCVAGRAQAAPDAPQVTRDNFVSLNWRVSARADENRTFEYRFDKDSISLLPIQIGGGYGGFGGTVPPYSPPDVRPLSTNQFEALIRALQVADVPNIASNNAVPPKLKESLTLILSDENNADKTYVLAYSEGKRSAAYRKLSDYLAQFVRGKGLAQFEPTAPATPPQ